MVFISMRRCNVAVANMQCTWHAMCLVGPIGCGIEMMANYTTLTWISAVVRCGMSRQVKQAGTYAALLVVAPLCTRLLVSYYT
jgi:hypothetical protein